MIPGTFDGCGTEMGRSRSYKSNLEKHKPVMGMGKCISGDLL